MRIALVGRYPLQPGGFIGGDEASTAHLIDGLTALGQDEIHLVTLSSHIDAEITRREGPVSYHFIPSPGRLQTLSWYAIPRRRIRRALQAIGPDIVHAQNSRVFGNACLATRYPVVVSVHGIIAEEMRSIVGWRPRARAWVHSVMLQRSVIRRAKHIIQPTQYPESHFASITNAQWYDTGNAVGDLYFRTPPASRAHILYAGAILRRKRLGDLVEALALIADRYPEANVRVAGPVVEQDYDAEVRARIGRLGLNARVTFLGLLDPSDLAVEYRSAQLLVLPSDQETSPMVIAESMASSTPVVATDVGGVRYLVEDDVSGYVVPVGNIQTLADRIDRLLGDRDLAARFGKAGFEKAVASFTSRTVAEQVRAVYQRVVAEWSLR